MAKKVAVVLGIAAACGLGWIVSRDVLRRDGSGGPPPPHAVARREAPVAEEIRPAAVEPEASAATADASPARPPFASVHGTLLDPEDTPLAGARILALAEIAEEDATRLRKIGFPDAGLRPRDRRRGPPGRRRARPARPPLPPRGLPSLEEDGRGRRDRPRAPRARALLAQCPVRGLQGLERDARGGPPAGCPGDRGPRAHPATRAGEDRLRPANSGRKPR
jgi:hypothetical protein